MSRLATILALILQCAPVFAAGPQVLGVSGASGVDLTGQVRIYGAVLGSNREDTTCAGTADRINTCSTCTATYLSSCVNGNKLCVCATKLIYDNLALQISVKNTATNSPRVYLAYANNGSYTRIGEGVSGNPNSVSVLWGDVCRAIGSAGACSNYSPSTTNTNGLLSAAIFYDTNNDGIYQNGEELTQISIQFYAPTGSQAIAGNYGINSFIPFPGDQKIYITEPDSTNFPSLEHGGRSVATRVFLSTTSMDSATPLSSVAPQDLSITETGSEFTSNIVDGLSNGTWYYVRLAQMDAAGNILNYFPNFNVPNCATPQTCPYAVKPDEVLGLLSQDMNCFIASAAYGSALEPKLRVFRDFRYKVLLRHPWGVNFVKAYYHYGPYAARFIADKPALRELTQWLLWPAYAFSYLALKTGFAAAFAFFILILASLGVASRLSLRRLYKRG